MDEIQNDLDSAPDLPQSQVAPESSVDSSASGDTGSDSFQQLQERMTGEDSPWYSPSAGHVVTKDGETILHPKTGLPFKSEAEYQQHLKAAPEKIDTAKPKITNAQPAKTAPMQKSFAQYIRGENKETTPDILRTMAEAGKDYQYKDELFYSVDPTKANASGQPQKTEEIDPFERVEQTKEVLESALVAPFSRVKDALVQQGADPNLVDQLLAPILADNRKIVDEEYKKSYQNALKETAKAPYEKEKQSAEQQRIETESMKNIKTLAGKYYPQSGEDQFFALINGHYENGNFVRGPAANIIDLAARLSNRGQTFTTESERHAAIQKTFRSMTADPAEARVLFDLAHYYTIGKEFTNAKQMIYAQGKQDAANEQRRKQQTIKTHPASFASPDTSSDDGMPSLVRTVTRQMAGRN